MARVPSDEKLKILRENLVELRRGFDQVNSGYNQLRSKALAFIAGEVAIVTFLFSSSIHFPNVLYGQILFIAAVILMLISFCLLIWTIATVRWKIPCDLDNTEDLYKKRGSELAMLEYMNDDYVNVIKFCVIIADKKAKRFNWTIYLLLAGVIMLLLLKYGGPQL